MDGWMAEKAELEQSEGSSSHPTEALIKIIKMKR